MLVDFNKLIITVVIETINALNLINPVSLDIKQHILDELEIEEVFTIPHTNIMVDETTVVSWIIMGAIFLVSFLLTRNLKVEGDISKRQLFLEMCIDKMRAFFKNILGKEGEEYIPWLMTVAVYIGASNMVGLFGMKPPTKSMQVTGALALMTIVVVESAGIKHKGIKGHLKSFAEPVAVVLPINIMEIAIKPISLCMRLFGNIIGAFIIMELIKYFWFTNIGVSLIFGFYFDLFDGFLQAYIFVFLSSIYIQEAIE